MGRKISGHYPSISPPPPTDHYHQKPHQTNIKSFSSPGASVLPKPAYNSPVGSPMNEPFHMDFIKKGQNMLVPFNIEQK